VPAKVVRCPEPAPIGSAATSPTSA
jgi:hypothetical protein